MVKKTTPKKANNSKKQKQTASKQKKKMKKNRSKMKSVNSPKPDKILELVECMTLEQYQLYWVKIKGFKVWPGVFESKNGTSQFNFHFFGDYSKCSKVNRSNILANFSDGFVKFEKIYKSDAKLTKAVKEASLFAIAQNKSRYALKSCCICDHLNKR